MTPKGKSDERDHHIAALAEHLWEGQKIHGLLGKHKNEPLLATEHEMAKLWWQGVEAYFNEHMRDRLSSFTRDIPPVPREFQGKIKAEIRNKVKWKTEYLHEIIQQLRREDR